MTKIYSILIFASLFFCISANTFSQSKKIGIALSGGGAKGLAHVGVLKVLEEAGIYPDYITGTSMGSVIGGLYAIGYTSQELDSLVRALEWSNYFTDTYDRSYRTIEEKDDMERYIFSFPFENGKIRLPRGFVDGQKLAILLSNLTLKAHGIDDFNDFQIPFRCIGTDLETGQAVVFDSGFLPDAIRGSIGIPSIFEPEEIDERLIVDGGISRNLPVQDAFDMGADIVIAVDVGAILFKKDELGSIFEVLDQTSSYQIARSNQQQLNLASVVIRPDISPFTAMDFSNPDSIILAGEKAAREMLPEIKKLVDENGIVQKKRKGIPLKTPKEVLIKAVEVVGLDSTSRNTLLNILQINKSKKYEIGKIEDQVSRIIATGLFDKLNYQLIPEDKQYRLKITARKTNNIALKIGLNYHSNFNAGILFNTTVQNALLSGSKFSLDLRVSENPALRANYLIYTKSRPNIGLRLSGLANLYPGFLYLENQLVDEYNFAAAMTRMDIFSGLGSNTSIGIGISAEYRRLDKRFLELEDDKPSIGQLTGHFSFDYDCLNRKYFPTSGAQLQLYGNLILDGRLKFSNDEDSDISTTHNTYNLFSYRQLFSFSPGLVMEWYNWAGYSSFNKTDFTQLFYLGRSLPYNERFIPFSGFTYMERPAGNFAFSGIKFQQEISKNIFTALSFNYGYFKTPAFTYIDDNGYNTAEEEQGRMTGLGFEVGMLSKLGPLSLTSEINLETYDFNFLFQMGFSF